MTDENREPFEALDSQRCRRQRKLRPGPGHSAEEVAANQRARLQEAMVDLVAERGYGAVTVNDLVRLAGVSKPTLYKHFTDREECFLATYDLIVETAVRRILASTNPRGDWRESVRGGFATFAAQLAENPAAARLALVEVFAAGPAALKRMRRTDGLFEALVVRGFAKGPDKVELPPLIVKGIVAGAVQVVMARLARGDEQELGPDLEALTNWTLSFADRAAVDICSAELPLKPLSPSTPDWDGDLAHLQRSLGRDDRALILMATARLAATESHAGLTVPRICAAAGVSRRSFDRHFEGATDCFLTALRVLGERALADARSAYVSAGDWPTGIHRVLASLCARATRDPVLVRLAFIEIFSPGPVVVPWRSAFMTHASRLLSLGAAQGQGLPGPAAEASTAAIWSVVRHHVASGRVSRLPRAAPALSFLALAPAIGGRAASEVILTEVGDGRSAAGARLGTGGPPTSVDTNSISHAITE